ncbi:hypothetical protein O181_100173 [Austropuccinia psidii MF-1]|uniref:Uncharacterized protein n=1 Tax=Austropuccinia psidii MF-1 TaxID=1389203 RepID=A0A9Q3JE59_9BASI|nr:hypothetical protein [Austropuccinia psidii MF-1]
MDQITPYNTRQTKLWHESTQTEDNHKTNVINSIQSLKHEFRNSQRYNNSKMNDIEQLFHTLPRMSTPFNQNEGTRIANPLVLEVENSHLKNEFTNSLHNLEPSMGQELLKEVPKIEKCPNFSGDGEYDHMEFLRGIDMIKEYFELPDRLVTARFNTLFTRSAHRWYIKLTQAHGHQSWTWWKTQIIVTTRALTLLDSIQHISAISSLWQFENIHNHWPNWPSHLFLPFMVIALLGPTWPLHHQQALPGLKIQLKSLIQYRTAVSLKESVTGALKEARVAWHSGIKNSLGGLQRI